MSIQPELAITSRPDAWNPLHAPSDPGIHWTRANVGEAMPGVQTPLSWTLWRGAIERGSREALFAVGALSRAERTVPARVEDQAVRIFYGRPALRVDFLTTLGDRMPGTTGEETARNVLGSVPDDLDFHPTRRRYPVVAYRLPLAFGTTPSMARRFARDTDRWYSDRVAGIASLDATQASVLFAETSDRFKRAVLLQIQTLFAAVQPLYQALERVVAKTGVGDVATLSGVGGAEAAVVADIWRAAHGEIPLAGVVAAHGFHGPLEGELSSHVWREDDGPLRSLLTRYSEREDPRRTRDLAAVRETQRQVADACPAVSRPTVRALLMLAARTIPMRGVVKRSFLQCFDVARACARRYGALLEASGEIETADDVFFLTADELIGGTLPADVLDLIAKRRERHTEYTGFDIPASWVGLPLPMIGRDTDSGLRVVGTGVSPGVVEATAHVVTDPSFVDVEPDRILVAPTTDPSWSSIMFISAGLVVDIGGTMSHAAVVAREMGIPCVVGTGRGTCVIRTGDRIRIDGRTGVVEILERT